MKRKMFNDKNSEGKSECKTVTTMRDLEVQLTKHWETIVIGGRMARKLSRASCWLCLLIAIVAFLVAIGMEFMCHGSTAMNSGRFITLYSFPEVIIPSVIMVVSGYNWLSIRKFRNILKTEYSLVDDTGESNVYQRNI